LGEVFLEFSIVLSSLAILAKRRMLWYVSIVSGTIGVVVAVTIFNVPSLMDKFQ
jgi:hypothetical protein